MKKWDYILNIIIDILFCLAICICCFVLIYSMLNFVQSSNYLNNTIGDLANISKGLTGETEFSSVRNPEENVELESSIIGTAKNDFGETDYLERLIDKTMKLQELESKSASANIMTFLYTFLSGTLIGVATYLTRKSAENVKQIKEDKELVTNLDKHTLFSNLYMYVQRTYSTIQIFSVSLDVIKDEGEQYNFINKYVPRLNELVNELKRYAENKQSNIALLSNADKKSIRDEINEMESLIDNLIVLDNSSIITNSIDDIVKTEWKNQLQKVKEMLK